MQVSATLFICSIDICIDDTFSLIFLQYSIPILLSSGALVKSVNNITVTERVTRCSAIAERPRCSVRYSFRQK